MTIDTTKSCTSRTIFLQIIFFHRENFATLVCEVASKPFEIFLRDQKNKKSSICIESLCFELKHICLKYKTLFFCFCSGEGNFVGGLNKMLLVAFVFLSAALGFYIGRQKLAKESKYVPLGDATKEMETEISYRTF